MSAAVTAFHAGNHADVLKHTVQSPIIESLKRERKPFLLSGHARGRGALSVGKEHAERTGEYLEGTPVSGSRTICPPNWNRILAS